jgi:hypothetical protein
MPPWWSGTEVPPSVRGTDGPIRATVDVLVEPLADSRKEMPGNMAALKQRMEAG